MMHPKVMGQLGQHIGLRGGNTLMQREKLRPQKGEEKCQDW